jgi:hypothetical protein
VIVEGFFDCLKVHQAGIPCVVALIGVFTFAPPRTASRGALSRSHIAA